MICRIGISKFEILISKSETNSNIKFSNDPNPYQLNPKFFCLGNLNFGHFILPFDLAQGGELVEPFRISDFVLRI
jgi:hypothetical protein